jgi:hypothetical protein
MFRSTARPRVCDENSATAAMRGVDREGDAVGRGGGAQVHVGGGGVAVQLVSALAGHGHERALDASLHGRVELVSADNGGPTRVGATLRAEAGERGEHLVGPSLVRALRAAGEIPVLPRESEIAIAFRGIE